MRTISLLVAAVATVLLVSSVRADDEEHIRAAQEALRSAREHLKSAGGGFGGHRQQAIDRIDNALQDLNAALRVSGKKEHHEEKKVQHIDKRINELEQRKQKLNPD